MTRSDTSYPPIHLKHLRITSPVFPGLSVAGLRPAADTTPGLVAGCARVSVYRHMHADRGAARVLYNSTRSHTCGPEPVPPPRPARLRLPRAVGDAALVATSQITSSWSRQRARVPRPLCAAACSATSLTASTRSSARLSVAAFRRAEAPGRTCDNPCGRCDNAPLAARQRHAAPAGSETSRRTPRSSAAADDSTSGWVRLASHTADSSSAIRTGRDLRSAPHAVKRFVPLASRSSPPHASPDHSPTYRTARRTADEGSTRDIRAVTPERGHIAIHIPASGPAHP